MMTVLIVDDSHVLRKIFSEILQSRSIEVMLASNGVEAIEKIKEHSPDLVITDLVMPQMNGYELCRWIKKNPSTKRIPVLLCSTRNYEVDFQWGKKQGADAFITKPFAPSELFNALNKFLPCISTQTSIQA